MTSWSLFVLAAGMRTLVLPFENIGPNPSDDWKGLAFEEAISVHLERAGHDVVDLETRNQKLRELGFVPGEPLSRASAIVVAKEVGAERLVVGAFRPDADRLEVEARVIDLDKGATVGIVDDYASPDAVAKLSNQVAKNLFRLEAQEPPPDFDEHADRRAGLSLEALEEAAHARVSDERDAKRRHLEKALELEPRYVEARVMLGRLLLDAGEPRRAIEVLVAAGEDGASDRKAYFDLGLAYLAVEEWGSALEVFGNLAGRPDARGASFNNQGVALMRRGRLGEAAEAFRVAVDSEPAHPTFVFNLGWALWRSGKGALALEQFERATELMPWDGEAQLLLSAAASSQARAEDAARARVAAELLAPHLSDVDPAVVTGWARPCDAVRRAAVSIEEEGEDVVALVEILDVRALRELGRLGEAIQILQQSLYREPGAVELRRELVDLHIEAGELEQAARELSMLLWTEPSVDAHVELARVYLELDDPSKALDEVEKALEIDPDHPEARRLREELAPPALELSPSSGCP